MKNQVMQIVEQICNAKCSDCRGIDKRNLARKLMNLANIPQSANISEIPIALNRQVNILFLLPEDQNYYSLFAGIGNDGKFYFKLSITGVLLADGYFDFYEEHGKSDQVLPIDYFLNRKLSVNVNNTQSMKPYTVFYNYNGTIYHNVWDAETLEDAITDAKYQLEDCKVGYTVLEDMTRELKENQY